MLVVYLVIRLEVCFVCCVGFLFVLGVLRLWLFVVWLLFGLRVFAVEVGLVGCLGLVGSLCLFGGLCLVGGLLRLVWGGVCLELAVMCMVAVAALLGVVCGVALLGWLC